MAGTDGYQDPTAPESLEPGQGGRTGPEQGRVARIAPRIASSPPRSPCRPIGPLGNRADAAVVGRGRTSRTRPRRVGGPRSSGELRREWLGSDRPGQGDRLAVRGHPEGRQSMSRPIPVLPPFFEEFEPLGRQERPEDSLLPGSQKTQA